MATVGGNLNSFAVTVDGFTLTGADLVALGAYGDRLPDAIPLANQLVRITGLAPFTHGDVLLDR